MAFEYPVKLQVAFTCGNRCAKCKIAILLRDSDGDASHRGECAHIAGDKPGAERYDATMTDDERNGEKNGLFLCVDCHDEIDKRNPQKYSTAMLQKMKADHESFVEKAMATAVGNITFKELKHVCTLLLSNVAPAYQPPNYLLTELQEKIDFNKLGPKSKRYIIIGLSLQHEVQRFLDAESLIDPNFATRLRDGFLAEYYRQRAAGISGDGLYESMISLAGRLEIDEFTAVHGVVAYLFEKCELFEKKPV